MMMMMMMMITIIINLTEIYVLSKLTSHVQRKSIYICNKHTTDGIKLHEAFHILRT